MKFEKIQPKGKYYKKQTPDANKKAIKPEAEYLPVYVFAIDPKKREVLASIAQAPPLWFKAPKYGRWLAAKPAEVTNAQKQNLKYGR